MSIMASISNGLLLFVDGDCTKDEMKKIIKKLKKKLTKENKFPLIRNLSKPIEFCIKREKVDQIKSGVRKRKLQKNVESLDTDSHSSSSTSEIKCKGRKQRKIEVRDDKKLNSRLSRLLKKKKSQEFKQSNLTYDLSANNKFNIDSDDTISSCNSTDSVDSGIQCDQCIEERLKQSSIDKNRIVALDCEFVGVGPNQISALGRCTIVNYNGEVICDIFAKPNERITDYRTPWSGLRRKDMINAVPIEIARNSIKKILQNKIVVGHAVHNDFRVLDIQHPKHCIRDTARCEILQSMAHLQGSQGGSLKNISHKLLGRKIQDGEHCSIEDSLATLDLYKLVEDKWEQCINCLPGEQQGTSLNGTELNDIDDALLNDEYWPDEL